MQNDPFSQPGYTDNFYDAVGGHQTFVKLIDVFYDGVATDPLLRPMYPEEDLAPAKRRFLMFLEQYWGGPTTYGEERGHPRLRMRHMPFRVTPEAKDRWLFHMRDGRGLPGVAAAVRGNPVGLHGARRAVHGEQPVGPRTRACLRHSLTGRRSAAGRARPRQDVPAGTAEAEPAAGAVEHLLAVGQEPECEGGEGCSGRKPASRPGRGPRRRRGHC